MWSQIRYTQVSAQHSCAGRGPPVVRRIAPTPQLRPTTTRLSATGPQTNVASDAASLSQPSVPDASKPKGPTRPKGPAYVDPFAKVIEAEKSGLTVEVQVKSLNKGGLVVLFGEMRGFLPYNQLAALKQSAIDPMTTLSYLVGQTIKAKVVAVETEGGRKDFVVSERKAQQGAAMSLLKLGAVMKAVVTSVEDYGAFVDLVELPGVSGLVHKSELSWDSIMTVESIVQKGQVVQVKVIDLDASKCRLGLSVRQTQPDPIRVTLDTVQWGGSSAQLPAEMHQLMERLKAQPGVEDVHIGRQATEAKIASQELVVYMTKDVPSADGFDVVARLGGVMQELYVVAKMDREEAKSMLARAVRSE